MDIEELKASDEIAMGVAIHKLKTVIDRYLDTGVAGVCGQRADQNAPRRRDVLS